MKNEAVLILDFGGQYSQLIARRVRDCHVYCEIRPYHTPLETIRGAGYRGIIFRAGRTASMRKARPDAPPGSLRSASQSSASVTALS